MKEFIDTCEVHSRRPDVCIGRAGHAPFLGMQRFMQAAGIPSMVHVPYPAQTRRLGSHIRRRSSQCSRHLRPRCRSPSTARSDCLAVSGPTRDPNAPEAPTSGQGPVLPGFESNTWFTLMTSPQKRRPMSWRKSRATDVGRAMRDPVVIKRIKDLNSTPVGNTAEEFRQMIKE